METRIFIPPTLCGCEFEINANWPFGLVDDGTGRKVSYYWPKNDTRDEKNIGSIRTIATCPQHQHFLTDPLPTDPYLSPSAGYLRPVPTNPTPDEKLFIQMFRFACGGRVEFQCGCFAGWKQERKEFNPNAEPEIIKHPLYSKKCQHHQNDTDDCQAASFEQNLINDYKIKVFNKIPGAFKQLTVLEQSQLELFMRAQGDMSPIPTEVQIKEYKWSLDAQRNLEVDLTGLSDADKQFADAEAKKLFGNKVKTK